MHRSISLPLVARLLLAAGLLSVLPTGSLGASRRPAWTVQGDHLLDLDVGLASVEGRYGFDVGEFNANITLSFDGRGKLQAAGVTAGAFPTIYTATGTWGPDPDTGRTRVTLAASGFQFEGVLDSGGSALVGTHTRQSGFGGGSGSSSGPLVLGRTPPRGAPSTFALLASFDQSAKGRIKAARLQEAGRARRVEATLQIWDGEILGKGKVKGKFSVDKSGATVGKLKIRGKGWSVAMEGPVDQDGFHAVADVRTPLLDATAVAITVPVEEALGGPAPKPPPPPRNQLDQATAFLGGGPVEIFRGGVPSRFFGTKVDLTIEFPTSVGTGVAVADPGTDGLAQPVRFHFANRRGKTWGTATAPASVTIEVLEWTTVRGESIKLRATGKVATASGSTKKVDVIVLARVL